MNQNTMERIELLKDLVDLCDFCMKHPVIWPNLDFNNRMELRSKRNQAAWRLESLMYEEGMYECC